MRMVLYSSSRLVHIYVSPDGLASNYHHGVWAPVARRSKMKTRCFCGEV